MGRCIEIGGNVAHAGDDEADECEAAFGDGGGEARQDLGFHHAQRLRATAIPISTRDATR
jgi:hypothetical protein